MTNKGNQKPRPFREIKGSSRKPGGPRRMLNEFDRDTFHEIVEFARRQDVCAAEAVRILVQWGLEADATPEEALRLVG